MFDNSIPKFNDAWNIIIWNPFIYIILLRLFNNKVHLLFNWHLAKILFFFLHCIFVHIHIFRWYFVVFVPLNFFMFLWWDTCTRITYLIKISFTKFPNFFITKVVIRLFLVDLSYDFVYITLNFFSGIFDSNPKLGVLLTNMNHLFDNRWIHLLFLKLLFVVLVLNHTKALNYLIIAIFKLLVILLIIWTHMFWIIFNIHFKLIYQFTNLIIF